MGMNHLYHRKPRFAWTCFKKKWVREIIRINPITLHLKESCKGLWRLRVVNMGSNQSIVQMHIGFLDLIENIDCKNHLVARGESSYKLGCYIEVLEEIGFENLGMDLLYLFEVGPLVEVRELLFQQSSSWNPCWGSDWRGNLHCEIHNLDFR